MRQAGRRSLGGQVLPGCWRITMEELMLDLDPGWRSEATWRDSEATRQVGGR